MTDENRVCGGLPGHLTNRDQQTKHKYLLLRLSKNPAMPAWNAAASELGLHGAGAGGGELPLQSAAKGREDVWTTSTLPLPSHLILKIIF